MINDLNWIAIPGGPGLSKTYLEYGLLNFLPEKKIHFYDVLGSPESSNKSPSIQELIDQVKIFAIKNNFNEYGLITHSFGNYIGLRHLKNNKKVRALLMLSPMPFIYKNWKEALLNIFNKLPQDLIEKFPKLSFSETGSTELFKLLYPYYIGNMKQSLPIPVRFDINSCNLISDQIKDYDDRELILSTEIPMMQIVGEKDPFFEQNKNILLDKTLVLKGLGHYPFLEDPKKFSQSTLDVMENLCQQI